MRPKNPRKSSHFGREENIGEASLQDSDHCLRNIRCCLLEKTLEML